MATSRTRNLRLFLSSGLSTEAKTNLEILDRLGGVYQVDNSEAVNIRSKTDIRLLPGDAAAGGAPVQNGIGINSLYIGSESTPLKNFIVHSNVFELNGALRLPDYDVTSLASRKYLTIRYNSAAGTEADPNDTQDRTLYLDVQNGDRTLKFGQDFEIAGGHTTKINTTASTDVTLPTTGILATRANTETFLNKTLTSPHITTPTGIVKADVGLSEVDNTSDATKWAATATLTNKTISGTNNTLLNIPYEAVVLTNKIVNSDINSAAGIQYSKLNLVDSIKNADIASTAAIDATKIAVNNINNLITTNLQTALLDLQQDVDSRATQADFANHTADTSAHGTLSAMVGVDDQQTLTNKTLDANPIIYGGSNTLTNIRDESIHINAGIQYSKLDLTQGLRNTDWSEEPLAKLAGTKVAPDFGFQMVETDIGVKIGQTFHTTIAKADVGQTQDLMFRLPKDSGGLNFVLVTDGLGNTSWSAAQGSGSVSKVGMTVPSILSVTTRDGNGAVIPVEPGQTIPFIVATGQFDLALSNQTADKVLASPIGSSGTPLFRSLAETDLPSPLNSSANRSQMISDQVNATIQNATGISWTYNSGNRTLTPALNIGAFSTSNLPEGSNLYYTDARVNTKVKGMIATNDGITSGVIIAHGSSPDSVSFSVRQATINTDNITEGTTNLFFTDERAQDAVNSLLIDSTEIAKSYDDSNNQLSLSLKTTGVVANGYGSASKTVTIAVDNKGRLTSAAEQNISIASTQVSDFAEAVQDVVGGSLVGSSNDIAPTYVDGSDALTLALKKESITSKTAVSPANEDYIMISDASDSDNLKKVSLQSIANLSGANFTATWATADGTSKVITHNLASRDVLIQIYSLDTYEDILVDSVVRTDVDTVTLTASEVPAGSGWKVLIRRI